MRYGSVCSGIEAATVAWHTLGWQAEWYSEIEKFPSAVLAHHYPEVPNKGDMTKFKEWGLFHESIDLLVGGTPCQSFSVAGLRKGLDDPRGSLMLTYLAIAESTRARWLVWENVPGVLSSNGGRDFGTFLGALAQLGYGFAYRVLDAQYFGVAQRRRRVFVVGYLGDWRRAAAVLFERHSLSGHPAPSRETRQGIATGTASGFSSGIDPDVMNTLCATDAAKWGSNQWVKEGKAVLQPICVHGTQDPDIRVDHAHAIGRNSGQENAVTYGIPGNWIGRKPENGGNAVEPMHDVAPRQTRVDKHAVAVCVTGEVTHTLKAEGFDASEDGTGRGQPIVPAAMAVRRLTPVECERLQGFPDGYTDIRPKGKDTPDGPRYKALGNSMAVPVMRWIGERIQMVEGIA